MIEKVDSLFTSYILDKSNKDELLEVQKLRYEFLNREYNPSLPENGIDDDGFDEISDILVVKENSTNKIVGTYRVTTPLTNKESKPYLIEEQFNIDSIKNSGLLFGHLSRACVHKDYRNGLVLKKLFALIYYYFKENNLKLSVGSVSFHGTDPKKYPNAFSHLYRKYLIDDYKVESIMNPFSLNMIEDGAEINLLNLKKEMPGLMEMYLLFSARIFKEGSIDKKFNVCDVFMLIDFSKINPRVLHFFVK